jgi:plastocyanin
MLVPMLNVIQVRGGTSSFQLFGSASLGWGFSSGTITSPGPTMTVSQGDLVNLTLTSQDGFPHQLFVDYNGNGSPDAGEPTSPQFSSTINFQFTATLAGNFTYHCAIHPLVMRGAFIVTPTHDVAITDIKPSKTNVGQGTTMQVNVTVANLGGFNETFNVTLFRLGTVRILTLNGSASTGWNNTIPGPTITVNQNDTIVLTLTSLDGLPHKFFVDYNGNVAPDPGEPTSPTVQSTTIKYMFTADTVGTFSYYCAFHPGVMHGTFNVISPATNTTLGAQLVTILTPSEVRNLTFSWNTSGVAMGKYVLAAVADTVVNETNTANNVFTGGRVQVTIPGDLNGDFTVDIYDAILLANAFNSAPYKPSWNSNADLNGDETVDIYDAIILAAHFGKSDP